MSEIWNLFKMTPTYTFFLLLKKIFNINLLLYTGRVLMEIVSWILFPYKGGVRTLIKIWSWRIAGSDNNSFHKFHGVYCDQAADYKEGENSGGR